jgi:hypothetical protein
MHPELDDVRAATYVISAGTSRAGFGDRRGFRLPLDRMVLTLSEGPAYNDGPSAQATWPGRYTDHSAHRQEGADAFKTIAGPTDRKGGHCMGLTAALPGAATV